MECAKPSLRQGFVFFINGLERYWNYSVTVYRKFSKITPGSAKCGGWGDMRTPTPPRHYATQCGAAAGPASRRERRALGLHALAREAECWGVRGKHSPALLSFRNLQNFAHTIHPPSHSRPSMASANDIINGIYLVAHTFFYLLPLL